MKLKEKQIQTNRDLVDPSSDSDAMAEDEGQVGNPGWADSIARVLKTNKPKKKKCLVLSRAKKLQQVKKEEKTYDFEIEGEIEEVKPDTGALVNKVRIKKEFKDKLSRRVKPTIKDREREKALKKVATKGVVQLFNAVRIQQKDLQDQLQQAGRLDHRKDAVLNNINKRKFLDVLMGGERAKSQLVDNPIKEEGIKEESEDEDESFKDHNKSQWSVLRDDFMTNKKLKHWDKEDSDAEDSDNRSNSTNHISSDDE